MINFAKLIYMGMWFDTCPIGKLNLSDNLQLQLELNDILELLE